MQYSAQCHLQLQPNRHWHQHWHWHWHRHWHWHWHWDITGGGCSKSRTYKTQIHQKHSSEEPSEKTFSSMLLGTDSLKLQGRCSNSIRIISLHCTRCINCNFRNRNYATLNILSSFCEVFWSSNLPAMDIYLIFCNSGKCLVSAEVKGCSNR